VIAGAVPRPGISGPHHGPFAVGLRVLHIIDRSRTIVLPDGRRRPRPITTIVRYPAVGDAGAGDALGAPPARAAGPFPLVVFGHGFAVTPSIYSRLLRAWAAAGFVVAAPVFPLENAHAPGGPDERDLVNQPQDMRVVIGRLLGADVCPRVWASGLIDGGPVAVAGQSDGGETALARVSRAEVWPGPAAGRVAESRAPSGARLAARPALGDLDRARAGATASAVARLAGGVVPPR
jgi:hypothetical protein